MMCVLSAALDSRKPRYWQFSVNELGEKDIAAQIEHIHHVKSAELRLKYGETGGAGAVGPSTDLPPCTLARDRLGDG